MLDWRCLWCCYLSSTLSFKNQTLCSLVGSESIASIPLASWFQVSVQMNAYCSSLTCWGREYHKGDMLAIVVIVTLWYKESGQNNSFKRTQLKIRFLIARTVCQQLPWSFWENPAATGQSDSYQGQLYILSEGDTCRQKDRQTGMFTHKQELWGGCQAHPTLPQFLLPPHTTLAGWSFSPLCPRHLLTVVYLT